MHLVLGDNHVIRHQFGCILESINPPSIWVYFRIQDKIGPLQFTITWYENRHAAEQTAHWDIQNKAT